MIEASKLPTYATAQQFIRDFKSLGVTVEHKTP